MGGNRAVRQMRRLCRSKGAEVFDAGIVNWTGKSRDGQIADVASRLGRIGG